MLSVDSSVEKKESEKANLTETILIKSPGRVILTRVRYFKIIQYLTILLLVVLCVIYLLN